MKKKLIILMPLLACTFVSLTLRAEDDAPPPYYPFSVGAEVGLTGAGGNAGWRFMDHLGIHGAMDYFRYTYNGTIQDVNYDATLRLMTETATLDVYPWTAHSFHISLGAAFNENHLYGQNSPGSYTINGNTYNGALNLDIKQHLVDPYVSIGGNLFYFDHKHHWAMTGELGGFYTGDPKVSLTSIPPAAGGSQQASDLSSEQAKIVKYANDVKFWPVLKLGFNFSF